MTSQHLKKSYPIHLAFFYFLVLCAWMAWLPHSDHFFRHWFSNLDTVVYRDDSFSHLIASHIRIVLQACLIALICGTSIAFLVTRQGYREFYSLFQTLLALMQAVPPIVVITITSPIFGFNNIPITISLIAYSILPIAQSTLNGLNAIPVSIYETAHVMGMTPWQIFRSIEIPMTAPMMVEGLRSALIMALGTAAIGSTVGAKTLGEPIIVGLTLFNTAYVIQGAICIALMVLIIDETCSWLELRIRQRLHQ